ncbi:hypothetical protein D3C73_1346860 [compost metagenome]
MSYVYQHNFHDSRWPNRNQPDNLYIHLAPFDAPAFKHGEPLKSIRTSLNYSGTDPVLVGWKAATVHVTANGRTGPIQLSTYGDSANSIFVVKPPRTYN